MRNTLLLTLSVSLCLACDSQTAPSGVAGTPESSASSQSDTPEFLTLAANAPAVVNPVITFWAVKGRDSEVIMYYAPQNGQPQGSKLLRFRVERRSLCTRPDGSAIANGDSVQITLTLADAARQVVHFAPAGLRFCSGREALLKMWYHEVDHDFDHDGDIDSQDVKYEKGLSIWRQESASSPWERLAGILDESDDSIDTRITGFTNYVVAY